MVRLTQACFEFAGASNTGVVCPHQHNMHRSASLPLSSTRHLCLDRVTYEQISVIKVCRLGLWLTAQNCPIRNECIVSIYPKRLRIWYSWRLTLPNSGRNLQLSIIVDINHFLILSNRMNTNIQFPPTVFKNGIIATWSYFCRYALPG